MRKQKNSMVQTKGYITKVKKETLTIPQVNKS